MQVRLLVTCLLHGYCAITNHPHLLNSESKEIARKVTKQRQKHITHKNQRRKPFMILLFLNCQVFQDF